MKKGKLIVIESGTDGSGKETQSELLFKKLNEDGFNVKTFSYPNYKNKSSTLVTMYLDGEFGDNPDEVNVFAASTFFAVDRFANYVKEWKDFYESGGIVLLDRYTTSNMVHQGAKIQDTKERDKYLEWLCHLEFELYELPKPDAVLFLDVTPEVSETLRKDRPNKNGKKKDIHESSSEHLNASYLNSLYIAEKYDWIKVQCIADNKMISIEEIHSSIMDEVYELLELTE